MNCATTGLQRAPALRLEQCASSVRLMIALVAAGLPWPREIGASKVVGRYRRARGDPVQRWGRWRRPVGARQLLSRAGGRRGCLPACTRRSRSDLRKSAVLIERHGVLQRGHARGRKLLGPDSHQTVYVYAHHVYAVSFTTLGACPIPVRRGRHQLKGR